ncbi:MAG TPA: hypothetical protein VJT80_21405 [Steroidobacteraceae bacterium]|jgi:hypothetical protein|nr:hypothetical protein [Steroidobacteraceae bacterium]
MTTERNPDTEPTVEIQRPVVQPPQAEIEDVDQDFDPERTLVRDDWESTAIRRVAPHVAAVQDELAADAAEPFGWESEAVRRLSRVVQNSSDQV